MRERAGFIIGISGVVLLLKPNFDPDQMAMYFLAYEVVDDGPELFHLRLVAAVAAGGEIVDESVEPNVDGVLLVAGHGDAPRHAGARDGLVFHAHAQEADHLVVADFRLDGK